MVARTDRRPMTPFFWGEKRPPRAVADLFTTKTKGSEPLSADRVVIGYEKE
jgi:hypothetical protein